MSTYVYYFIITEFVGIAKPKLHATTSIMSEHGSTQVYSYLKIIERYKHSVAVLL